VDAALAAAGLAARRRAIGRRSWPPGALVRYTPRRMESVARTAGLISIAALLSFGCAEQLHLLSRGAVVGGPRISFWPPPDATRTWSGPTEAAPSRLLGEAADRVGARLRSAGYADPRWYAIGARYAHGFVAITRLERVRDDGAPDEDGGRWSSLFPEASNLLWLEGAKKTRLPAEGRYRVLVVAFTDLPIGATNRAQPRSELTWMAERPGAPSTELPKTRRVSSDYRVGVYVYEYRSGAPDRQGTFVPGEGTAAGRPRIEVPSLSPLLGATR